MKSTDPKLNSEICESILRSLPLWFGIESAIVNYVKDVQTMPTWTVYDQGIPAGFMSINRHFPETAEIHVMGAREEYHGRGIGHALLEAVEKALREEKVKFLTVKTVSASSSNREYGLTRKFYLKAGFVPLEEFKTLWDAHNPCLFMAKAL